MGLNSQSTTYIIDTLRAHFVSTLNAASSDELSSGVYIDVSVLWAPVEWLQLIASLAVMFEGRVEKIR